MFISFKKAVEQEVNAITVKVLRTTFICGIVQYMGPSLSPPEGRQHTDWDKRIELIGTSSRKRTGTHR
jgi:hypothetical protein